MELETLLYFPLSSSVHHMNKVFICPNMRRSLPTDSNCCAPEDSPIPSKDSGTELSTPWPGQVNSSRLPARWDHAMRDPFRVEVVCAAAPLNKAHGSPSRRRRQMRSKNVRGLLPTTWSSAAQSVGSNAMAPCRDYILVGYLPYESEIARYVRTL